ncbi:hypothetical protein HA402_005670 [Bradysia odoriphaga]|nr:hypothetical protein HA402_005670 [Bradysia odoriphaga]
MDDRLNLGSEVRELKLGSSFNGNNSRTSTSFHTLKYDFKPTSLDLSKVATLDVSSNNQVTVSVPHLDTSGVPKTVFKGKPTKLHKRMCAHHRQSDRRDNIRKIAHKHSSEEDS